jgi:hypothetical protein
MPKSPRSRTAQSRAAPRRQRPDVVHTSLYLPAPAYHVLREIAFKEDRKVHDIVVEGIDAALAKRGYPPVGKLKAKTP